MGNRRRPLIRFGVLTLLLVAVIGVVELRAPSGHRADFSLEVSVLEAMEGGPLVLHATCVYQGKKELVVEPFPLEAFANWHGFQIEVPAAWRGNPDNPMVLEAGDKLIATEDTLVPGDKRCATAFLHRDYSRIPAGRYKLDATWCICELGAYGKQVPPVRQLLDDPRKVFRYGFRKAGAKDYVAGDPIAKLRCNVSLDILPATPENLAALRKRLEECLEHPQTADYIEALKRCFDRFGDFAEPQMKRAEEEQLMIRYVGECVIQTRHKELSHVVLKLFDTPAAHADYRLLDQIYRSRPDAGEANDFLLRYAIRSDSLRPLIPFGDNRWRTHSYTDGQIQSLRETKNPWVRMLTCVTFPKQCPAKWKAGLLLEMSKLAELPAAVEQLRLLDDPQFAVREKATARLDALEDLAEPAIRAHLNGKMSPEARRRCEQILADLQANGHDYNASSAMSILEASPNPEATAMLEALAKNPAECRICRKAKEALERRRQGAKQGK